MTCKTVVIGLNWVGDNILALPTFRALQHRFRHDGGVAVAVPQNVATLFAATGTFKKVIPWTGSTRERIRVLRGEEFERAIILPNSFRAAVVALAARIPERWGYSTDGRRLLLTNAVAKPGDRRHQLDDYTPLLAALNAPRVVDELPTVSLPSSLREKTRKRLRAAGIRLDRPLFGVHAGGLFGRAKHWGDTRYTETVERLRGEGYDVLLLTSPGERQQAEMIAAACNDIPMIGHDGDVMQLAAAISHCSVVITNDSGPLHLAAALAVPSVSIFGPTDPARTVIPGASRVIRRELACSPCYQRECPLRHHACMNDVAVDEVFQAAVGLFAEVDGRLVAERRAKSGL
jgi:heptosyltransferase-2